MDISKYLSTLHAPTHCPSCNRHIKNGGWYHLNVYGLFDEKVFTKRQQTITPTCIECWDKLPYEKRLAWAGLYYAGMLVRGGDSNDGDWEIIRDAVWCAVPSQTPV